MIWGIVGALSIINMAGAYYIGYNRGYMQREIDRLENLEIIDD